MKKKNRPHALRVHREEATPAQHQAVARPRQNRAWEQSNSMLFPGLPVFALHCVRCAADARNALPGHACRIIRSRCSEVNVSEKKVRDGSPARDEPTSERKTTSS